MRFGPGQASGRFVPKEAAAPPARPQVRGSVHRTRALAVREGGIGATPKMSAQQRAIANQLVSGYMAHQNASARVGPVGHALTRIYNNPIIGQKGLAGGIHDFGESLNPVALAQTAKQNLTHPFQSKPGQINAGIVVGGPFRGAPEEAAAGGRTVAHVEADLEALKKNPKSYSYKHGAPELTYFYWQTRRALETERDRIARGGKPPAPPRPTTPRPAEPAPEPRGPGLPEGALKAGAKAYKETVPLRSAERAQRFEKARAAGEQAGHGEAGYYAELGQLKGKLPHVSFDDLRAGHVSQENFDALMTRVATHPALTQGEKLSGRRALVEARDFGKPPPPHAQLIWQKAFGEARAKAMTPKDQHWLFDLATFPRAIMSTADLSGILRQGLVAAHQEPGLAAKAAAAQVRFFKSKDAFDASQHEITQRPNFERMQEGKLALTDIGGDLEHREEAFMSSISKHIPLMAGSSRAYIGGLNKLRADMFDKQVARAQAMGRDVNDPKLLRNIAKQINSATGRGDYGVRGNRYAPAANLMFFSPRLIKSRLDYLNPHWYATLDPLARRQAIKGATRLAATMATALYGAHLAGAKIEGDPRSSDFGKLRYGNLRIDPWGGFQQYVRAASQIGTNARKSTVTGKVESLGSHYGGATQFDVAKDFIHSKFAPVPSFIWDSLERKSYTGQKFSLPNAVMQRMVPLLWQDIYSVYQDKGSAGLAALIYGLGGVGLGVQDFKSTPPKQKGPKNPYLPTSGPTKTKNPYMPSTSGSSSSSNPYMP